MLYGSATAGGSLPSKPGPAEADNTDMTKSLKTIPTVPRGVLAYVRAVTLLLPVVTLLTVFTHDDWCVWPALGIAAITGLYAVLFHLSQPKALGWARWCFVWPLAAAATWLPDGPTGGFARGVLVADLAAAALGVGVAVLVRRYYRPFQRHFQVYCPRCDGYRIKFRTRLPLGHQTIKCKACHSVWHLGE